MREDVRQPTSDDHLTLVLSSRTRTESLGRAIGHAVTGGEVLALIGELGAGKTTVVRGVADGLAAPTADVSSPTFVLVHEYEGRLPLIHMDWYRLRSAAEAEGIGLQDLFTDRGITAIEWADRFPTLLPSDRLEIRLSHNKNRTRTAQLTAHGPLALRVLHDLHTAWPDSRPRTRIPQSRKISAR